MFQLFLFDIQSSFNFGNLKKRFLDQKVGEYAASARRRRGKNEEIKDFLENAILQFFGENPEKENFSGEEGGGNVTRLILNFKRWFFVFVNKILVLPKMHF